MDPEVFVRDISDHVSVPPHLVCLNSDLISGNVGVVVDSFPGESVNVLSLCNPIIGSKVRADPVFIVFH